MKNGESIDSSVAEWVLSEDILNIVIVYAPPVGLAEEIKRLFWKELDEVVQSMLQNEGLLIGGDFKMDI